jgi:hypothetical protein
MTEGELSPYDVAEFLFYNLFAPVEDSLLQWWWLRSGSAVLFCSLGNVLASAGPVISHNAVYGQLPVRHVAIYAPRSVTPGYYYRSMGGTSTSQELVA